MKQGFELFIEQVMKQVTDLIKIIDGILSATGSNIKLGETAILNGTYEPPAEISDEEEEK